MSRSRRQRDSVAPSLFPFLAVLLCTMGALVLILMLIVAGAQASARQTVQQAEQHAEEVESQLQLASYSYEKQLTEGRLNLEKKRLALQHLENHIQELLDELSQLKRTAELAEQEVETEKAEEERNAAISELEKQLLEATAKLKQKLDKPKGDKPIFAIIPYEGRNGTHRRPIYLECTEAGIKIQPEGVALQLDDLQPPYGPGNPLDAALRTIRTEYAPANHALTSTAYPLLIVRPSGIRAYAMARAAMSGWDDQFGYELIGEDLELAFPESQPGLRNKIAQAIDLARQRQAALVMAMPRKYRRSSESDDESWGGSGGDLGSAGSGQGGYADAGGGQHASSPLPGSTRSPLGGGPGGFSMSGNQELASANQPGGASGESLGFGTGTDGMAASDGAGQNTDWELPRNSLAASAGSNGLGADSTDSAEGSSFFGGQSGTTGELGLSGSGSEAASGATAGQSGSTGSGQSGSGQSGSSGGSAGSSPSPMTPGTQMAMPFNAPFSQSGSSSPDASASGQATNQSESAQSGSQAGNQAAGNTQTYSQNNASAAAQSGESSPPVAKRRGRGWAWSQGPPTQTAVVRAIRLQCLSDRWVVLADSSEAHAVNVTIPFVDSPQARAEKLAKVVADRVDSWGLALGGGYWKPVIVVDVAPEAQWRFDQLQQLLDGSGLELQRQPSPSR